MIWWKEWRETRFGFLTALLFVSGSYFSLPERRQLVDGYWLGMLIMFFAVAMGIALGSSAILSEVASGSIAFLLSKPTGKTRVLAAKYIVRAVELTLVFTIPVLGLIKWDDLQMWEWVRPYLMQKYIIVGTLSVLFIYSGSFFLSILFRKTQLSALASIAFLGVFLAFKGIPIMQKMYELERVENDLYLLILLCLVAFVASLALFRIREF